MKTKELATKTGIKERTIRFYEEQGLLCPRMERKNGRNFREYTQDDALRLTAIVTLRKARFTLEEIRDMLEGRSTPDEIYPNYLKRLQQEASTAKILEQAASGISIQGLDPYELARRLETSTRSLTLPEVDVSPHFGRFDPETPEEKQQAIAAYRERQNKKRLSPLHWGLVILSLVCLCLAVGCGGILFYFHEPPVEPAPNGTTDGYIYYKALENGTYYICRYEEATGITERLYESLENTLAFLVTEEKLYVDDGHCIYSVNADGSGKFRLYDNMGATAYGRMAVHDGWLYGSTGLPFQAVALARLNLDTLELEELNVGALTDFELLDGKLYTDFPGEILVLDLDTGEEISFEIGTSPVGVVIDQGVVYEIEQVSDQLQVTSYSLKNGQLQMQAHHLLDQWAYGGIKYVHDGIFYYHTTPQNAQSDLLCGLIMETGTVFPVTQVTKQAMPDVYFGKQGLLVADSVDAPQYILYDSMQ